VKPSVTKAMAEATNLTKVIQSNPAWIWARNPTVLAGIDAAQESINQVLCDDAFAQFYMTMSSKDAEKKYTNDFENQCGRFNTLLKDKTALLAKETAIVLDMHVARSKKMDGESKK